MRTGAKGNRKKPRGTDEMNPAPADHRDEERGAPPEEVGNSNRTFEDRRKVTFRTLLWFPAWASVFFREGACSSGEWARENRIAAHAAVTQDPECFPDQPRTNPRNPVPHGGELPGSSVGAAGLAGWVGGGSWDFAQGELKTRKRCRRSHATRRNQNTTRNPV